MKIKNAPSIVKLITFRAAKEEDSGNFWDYLFDELDNEEIYIVYDQDIDIVQYADLVDILKHIIERINKKTIGYSILSSKLEVIDTTLFMFVKSVKEAENKVVKALNRVDKKLEAERSRSMDPIESLDRKALEEALHEKDLEIERLKNTIKKPKKKK